MKLVSRAVRLLIMSLGVTLLANCASTQPPPAQKANSSAEQDQDGVAGQGISITSTTMGAMEEAWGFDYLPLKYYGFDNAADLLTERIIEEVHSCPYSAHDKADFDLWIRDAQHQFTLDMQHLPLTGATRPNLPDGEPSRDATRVAAKYIEAHLQKPNSLTGQCTVGGAVPD